MMEVDELIGAVGTLAMEGEEGGTDAKVAGKAKETIRSSGATAGPILTGRVRSLSFLDKELVHAAERGNLKRVKMALEEGAWVDRNNGEAALKAIENGHLEVVKVLFGKSQKYAIAYARCACQYDQAAILEYLLDSGVAVDVVKDGEEKWKDLHDLKWGSDPLEAHAVGAQPLHYAAFYGSESCAAALLKRGAAVDAETTNLSVFTPLHIAVICQKEAVVDLLIEKGANVNRQGRLDQSYSLTPLGWAVDRNSVKIAEALIEAGASDHTKETGPRQHIVIAARKHGGLQMLKLLVEKGASIDLLFRKAHFRDCSKGVHRWFLEESFESIPKEHLHITLEDYTSRSDVEMCQLLIEKGAPVNPIRVGRRFAILAAKYQEVLELFLDAGAKVNVADNKGITLLMKPFVLQDLALTQRLVRLGVNVNAKDKEGHNALWHAANKGGHRDVVRFLKERTAECTLL